MNITHCICRFKNDGVEGYFLWHSNDVDGVLVDEKRKLIVFTSVEELRSYAQDRRIPLSPESPSFYDLDELSVWIRNPSPESIDASKLLSNWNIFADVALSVGSSFDEEHLLTQTVYDKLFYANNLPSVNRGRSDILNSWSVEEAKLIARVLQSGLQIFRCNV